MRVPTDGNGMPRPFKPTDLLVKEGDIRIDSDGEMWDYRVEQCACNSTPFRGWLRMGERPLCRECQGSYVTRAVAVCMYVTEDATNGVLQITADGRAFMDLLNTSFPWTGPQHYQESKCYAFLDAYSQRAGTRYTLHHFRFVYRTERVAHVDDSLSGIK